MLVTMTHSSSTCLFPTFVLSWIQFGCWHTPVYRSICVPVWASPIVPGKTLKLYFSVGAATLLNRNNIYLADETEGSQAAILNTLDDGLLLGWGGSGGDTVITCRAMTGTQRAISHIITLQPDEASWNHEVIVYPRLQKILQQFQTEVNINHFLATILSLNITSAMHYNVVFELFLSLHGRVLSMQWL